MSPNVDPAEPLRQSYLRDRTFEHGCNDRF
jgi:hypothetical protein